jgi:adenylosuccinate synthase
MRAAIVTVGLGFGDEGKGMVVHHLAKKYEADLVVRYSGGCQAGHSVELEDGTTHTFSQFGAGSLSGVSTYIGPQVVVDPLAMFNEAVHLHKIAGRSPYADLSVHPDCLVATHYHRVLNRARELRRGEHAHGSCGMGVGAAREDYLRHGLDCLTMADLHRSGQHVIRKLDLLRQRTMLELDALDLGDDFRDEVVEDCFDNPVVSVAKLLIARAQPVHLASRPELRDARLVIFEGAQGTLLDQWRGFHPHTTWSDVTVNPDYDLLDAWSYAGVDFDELHTLGVTRAFTTRHGAGPLPSYDADLTARLVDRRNGPGRFQGAMRFGWMDLVLFKYAAEINGVDSIAATWLDQFNVEGNNRVCLGYEADSVPWFMSDPSDVRPGLHPNLRRSVQLAEHLASARPVVETWSERLLFDHLGRVSVAGRGPDESFYEDELVELDRLAVTRVAPQVALPKPSAA